MYMGSTDMQEIYWYAVHVRSRHEFKVFDYLNKSGIEAFLPIVERLSKWKDRKKLIDFPLFPGYLFVHIHKVYDNMLSVLKSPGVVRFLGIIPGEPQPVPEEQIISLMKLVESKKQIDPYPYLKEGEMVRVTNGPLKGIEGMLIEKRGQHMLVLSVDVLQQGAAVKIAASDVEKV